MENLIEIPPPERMTHAPFDPNNRTTVIRYMEMAGNLRSTEMGAGANEIYWFRVGQRILFEDFEVVALFLSTSGLPIHPAHGDVCKTLLELDGKGTLFGQENIPGNLMVANEILVHYKTLYPHLGAPRYLRSPVPQVYLGRYITPPLSETQTLAGDAHQWSMAVAPQFLALGWELGQHMAPRDANDATLNGDALYQPTPVGPPSLAPQPQPWEFMAPQDAMPTPPDEDEPVQPVAMAPYFPAPRPRLWEHMTPRDVIPAMPNGDAPIQLMVIAPQALPPQPQAGQHMAPSAAIASTPMGDLRQVPLPVAPLTLTQGHRNNTKNMTAEQVRALRPKDTRSQEYQQWRRWYKNVNQNESRRKASSGKAS